MIEEYCQNCGKVTGHKRAMGMGTFLGACITLGFSLMATPFYPKRCVICGCKSEPTWKADTSKITVNQELAERIKKIQENTPIRKLAKLINDKIGGDMKK